MLEEELIEKREMALLEKEGSGCRVLLANDMSEDLSRMFRLFSRVPEGLAPMADILKQHIAEVCTLTTIYITVVRYVTTVRRCLTKSSFFLSFFCCHLFI